MREFLRVTQEAVYNVFNLTPTTGQQVLISLPQDNSFTVRKKPNMMPIRSAGRNNRRVKMISETYDVNGGLKTYVRPSQAGLIATLLAGLGSGDCPNLPSFSCEHGFMLEDGSCTPFIMRYTGCMADGTLTASNTGEGTNMMADLKIIGATAVPITTTDFPVPVATDLTAIDNEQPYAFQDCIGALTVRSARTDFNSISFDFGNKIIPYRGETAMISRLNWRSRDPSVTIDNLYKTKQDRLDSDAIVAEPVSFTFSEGGHSMAFALGAQNYFNEPQDDLKIGDGWFMQKITLQNFIDPATGNDLVLTVA